MLYKLSGYKGWILRLVAGSDSLRMVPGSRDYVLLCKTSLGIVPGSRDYVLLCKTSLGIVSRKFSCDFHRLKITIYYIMPPMPPMPPIPPMPPPGIAGAAESLSLGLSATIASVVIMRAATLAAF